MANKNCSHCGFDFQGGKYQFCPNCGGGTSIQGNKIAFKGYTRNFILIIVYLLLDLPAACFLCFFNEKAKQSIRRGDYEKFREYEGKANTTVWVGLTIMVALITAPFGLVVVTWFFR
jgi:hypothetical protein